MTPRIISLDIETYGICAVNADGAPLPPQQHFHPQRSLRQDNVPVADLIQTCSLTIPTHDPRPSPSTPWSRELIGALRPDVSMCLVLANPEHRSILRQWLNHADTIIGWNLTFDLLYLRAVPAVAPFLPLHSKTLIDGQIVAYLENELRTERSLKTIGPVLGTHRYDDLTARTHRFASPHDPDLHRYNCQDTHNTLAVTARCANRIITTHSASDKLQPACVLFFSDLIWSVVAMLESGAPLSIPALTSLASAIQSESDELQKAAAAMNYRVSGDGTHRSQAALLNFLIDTIDGVTPCPNLADALAAALLPPRSLPSSSNQPTLFSNPSQTPPEPSTTAKTSAASTSNPTPSTSSPVAASVRDHPLLTYTKKKRNLSFVADNRRLLRALLPESHTDAHTLLAIIDRHTSLQKLLSSYIYPLLHHKRNNPSDTRSILLPEKINPEVGLGFMSCYLVPGQFSESSSDEGGQVQGRISFKNPSAQTFPPDISACYRSRFPGGSIISMDLSQIELRVAGIYSGDPFFVEEYRKPKPDLHRNMAVAAMGPDIVNSPHWKTGDRRTDPRQWGKTLSFWNVYRGGPSQGQRTLLKFTGRLFPYDFFRALADSRPTLFPRLWEWQERLLASAEQDGIIYLPITGHSRYFTGYRRNERGGEAKSLMNEIVNFPIQASAAITTHSIMARLVRTINHSLARLFLHVHDALYFDVHPSYRTDLLRQVDEAVAHVAKEGYWARLCEHTGNRIDLVHEITEKSGEPKGATQVAA